MSIGTSYDNMYKIVLDSSNAVSQTFSLLIENFDCISKAANNLLISFQTIPKGHSKNKNSFYIATIDWIRGFFDQIEIYRMQLQSLNSELISVIKEQKQLFDSGKLKSETQLEEAQAELDNASKIYVSSYQNYILHCQEMESLNTKMGVAEGEQLNTIKLKLDVMREECPEKERIAIDACELLNKKKRFAAMAIEASLIRFEKSLHSFFNKIKPMTTSYSKLNKLLSEKAKFIAKQFEQRIPDLQQKAQEICETIPIIKPPQALDGVTQIPQLDFNIFEFVSWKTVFSEDLSAKFATLKKHNSAFHDDDVFEIFSDHHDHYILQCERTGVRITVNKIEASPIKKYKRKVFEVVTEDPNDDLHTSVGQFVVGLWVFDDHVRYKTAQGKIGNISVLSLKEAKK